MEAENLDKNNPKLTILQQMNVFSGMVDTRVTASGSVYDTIKHI